jgi:cellulose synthase/poly-beta-1,6-N-acetylglucosamine synthase-like glycosyltransferase
MPPFWAIIVVFFYVATLLFVFCFSIVQLQLAFIYLFKKKSKLLPAIDLVNNEHFLPFITIQLPIYNELYVVDRLLESVAKIAYPKNRLEIQVLDDSTDETFEIVKLNIEKLVQQGFEIYHIHRTNRKGFKAGALANGLKTAKGEFIAIFDADFIIKSSFLLETLPYFQFENIGLVQTKWLHTNEKYSFLTKLQAFGLDAHFTIDQAGRNNSGYFMNFNGTGGIWRKACIEQAGGWSADCLTEDLDLSYRAQLAGWQFKYLEEIGNFAELPAEIQAVKSQQFRWAKGAAEVARKLLFKILKNPKLSISIKIHSFFHLLNSATYLSLVFIAILTIPVINIQQKHFQIAHFISFAQYFQISFVFLGIYFWVSFRQKNKNILHFLSFFPMFLAFMMGLSLHNAVGVIEGYLGKKSPFVRTPKFNINSKTDGWLHKKYVDSKFNFFEIIEFLFCIYFAWAIYFVVQIEAFGSLPFLAMLFFGYACVFGFGLYHKYLNRIK